MSAWVSRVVTTNGKRKLEAMEPGLTGIKSHDRFIVYYRDPHGRKRQRAIKGRGRPAKQLADSLALQLTGQLTLGQYNEKQPNRSWKDYRIHFQDLVMTQSPTTRSLYQESFDLFESICRPTTIAAVNKAMIDRFRNGLLNRRGRNKGSKASPATVNKHLRHIRLLLSNAVEDGELAKMPRIAMVREPEKIPRFMPAKDFDAIYGHCNTAVEPSGRPYSPEIWWRAVITVGILTGMRISEILSLRRDDVDFEHYLIRIQATSKGRREDLIPVHPIAIEHLRDLKGFGSLIFDWPGTKDQLYDQWHAIQTAAGIHVPCDEEHDHTYSCHHYGFHSLKMACGTLNASRMSSTALNAFMRHKSMATTIKHYLSGNHVAADVVGNLFIPDSVKRNG